MRRVLNAGDAPAYRCGLSTVAPAHLVTLISAGAPCMRTTRATLALATYRASLSAANNFSGTRRSSRRLGRLFSAAQPVSRGSVYATHSFCAGNTGITERCGDWRHARFASLADRKHLRLWAAPHPLSRSGAACCKHRRFLSGARMAHPLEERRTTEHVLRKNPFHRAAHRVAEDGAMPALIHLSPLVLRFGMEQMHYRRRLPRVLRLKTRLSGRGAGSRPGRAWRLENNDLHPPWRGWACSPRYPLAAGCGCAPAVLPACSVLQRITITPAASSCTYCAGYSIWCNLC